MTESTEDSNELEYTCGACGIVFDEPVENGLRCDCCPECGCTDIYEIWRPGRCPNCGSQGRHVIDSEYECVDCGYTWDIYEPPPDVPFETKE